ncbi:WD40 repeat-containing protein [Aspergillus oryzae 100-8]|uniref:Mitochondrial division protein 1 n=1 Tax=Aspergillus oryzae (strain 3.042) TaxID=1160506 RepID=I7ZLW2_ASPO3|nr:WD40 repeat-containing protein [Aspergillus oryzae 3.042]KAJ1708237.1 WD repeat protein [Aspergillus flavus]KDE83453.1 WD40 repeat-containing protein [Aspergillus oryzae 100-8]|eukprot:EIT72787.1 WD40 repeat-containing protein [Aspergillus oryzae 3.042]
MDGNNHRSKRRRLDRSPSHENGYIQSPVESSSDELAAGSDHDEAERRRASWTLQKALPPKRPNTRLRSFSGSESPDELAVDADVYWRSRNRGRNSSPSEVSAAGPSSEHYQDEEEVDADVDDNESPMEGDAEPEQAYSDRSPTPVPPPPPPPPPKPDKINYQQKFLLRGHLRGVSAVRFSPDSTMIASGGADGAVKVWDTLTGRLVHTFEGHLAGISTISWSPDGAIIASGSDDKTIRLWNVLTGKAHSIPFVGHHNYVYQIAFSPKGNMLVSGSYDEAVFLWDVRSATVMRSLPAHSDPVGGIDVVWDGTLIASCATDGLIRIWDTATGQCLRTLVHEDNPPVTSVKFSPNGKFVLAWSLDDCVRLWNYVEGRCIKTYQGHVNRKYSLSGGFGTYGVRGAPPHAFAVSGSEDGAVLCWDVVSKKTLQRIEGHTGVVLGVDTCTLGDKRLMVSCGIDQTVRVYEEVEEDGRIETDAKESPPAINGTEPNGTEPNGILPNGTTQNGAEGHDTSEQQDTGDTQEPQDTEMADADTVPEG